MTALIKIDSATGLPVPAAREDRARKSNSDRRCETARQMRRHLRVVEGDEADLPPMPKTRGECAGVPRPCPHVSCRHHAYLDVNEKTGTIRYNFPDKEVWEVPPQSSCSLDLADNGGMTLQQVGAVFGLTRERTRQIEEQAAAKVLARWNAEGISGDVRDVYEAALSRESHCPGDRQKRSPAKGGRWDDREDLDQERLSTGQDPPSDDEPEPADPPAYVPELPHVLDESVSDEQYCDAVWNLLMKREASRAEERLGPKLCDGESMLDWRTANVHAVIVAAWEHGGRSPTTEEIMAWADMGTLKRFRIRATIAKCAAILKKRGLIFGKKDAWRLPEKRQVSPEDQPGEPTSHEIRDPAKEAVGEGRIEE